MKNGLLIWNVALTLLTGYLLITHFSGSKSGRGASKSGGNDSATAADNNFKIAYFEMDSVEAHYSMVKDVKAEIETKESEYNKGVSKLDDTYKNRYNELASKPNMSAEDAEAAQNELKNLGEQLKLQRQTMDQGYQDFITTKNMAVKQRIEDFLKEYTKSKSFAYIISYEPGLYYYKDTAYNITSDLIAGLNAAYKPAKQK